MAATTSSARGHAMHILQATHGSPRAARRWFFAKQAGLPLQAGGRTCIVPPQANAYAAAALLLTPLDHTSRNASRYDVADTPKACSSFVLLKM